MVVGERDGRHAKFCTHGAQAHPLTLEVGVVFCELRKGACFGVGDDREIVARSIVARDKEAHEVTFTRNDGSACGQVHAPGPGHDHAVLAHAQWTGPCSDGDGSRLVAHHPVDVLHRARQVSVF